MRNRIIGVLVVLLLFLAAFCIRLSDRAQQLEDRLAKAEQRHRVEPKPAPAPQEAMPPSPAPLQPTPVEAKPVAPPPAPAPKITTDAVIVKPGELLSVTLVPADPEPEPGAGPRRGFLGIHGSDVPGGGVQVNGIVAGSVAEQSGLRPGDILLEYNGKPVKTLADLTTLVRDGGEGAPVSLRIRRENAEFYQGVQLGARSR